MKFYIFSTSRIYDTFQLQQMKCVVNWWKSLFRVTTIEFQFNLTQNVPSAKKPCVVKLYTTKKNMIFDRPTQLS